MKYHFCSGQCFSKMSLQLLEMRSWEHFQTQCITRNTCLYLFKASYQNCWQHKHAMLVSYCIVYFACCRSRHLGLVCSVIIFQPLHNPFCQTPLSEIVPTHNTVKLILEVNNFGHSHRNLPFRKDNSIIKLWTCLDSSLQHKINTFLVSLDHAYIHSKHLCTNEASRLLSLSVRSDICKRVSRE